MFEFTLLNVISVNGVQSDTCNKVVFNKKSFYAHKEEGDAGLIQIFGLCKDCALKSPSIFTEKYEIPKSVSDAEALHQSFNMRVDRVDTRQIFGLLVKVVSIDECDAEEEIRLDKQRQYNIIKSQLKAVASEIEQTMHISDPSIWRHIFDEAINELIVEGVMNG